MLAAPRTCLAIAVGLACSVAVATAAPAHPEPHAEAATIQATHAPADAYSAMLGFMPHVPVGLVLCGALALALTPLRGRDDRLRVDDGPAL